MSFTTPTHPYVLVVPLEGMDRGSALEGAMPLFMLLAKYALLGKYQHKSKTQVVTLDVEAAFIPKELESKPGFGDMIKAVKVHLPDDIQSYQFGSLIKV